MAENTQAKPGGSVWYNPLTWFSSDTAPGNKKDLVREGSEVVKENKNVDVPCREDRLAGVEEELGNIRPTIGAGFNCAKRGAGRDGH